MNSYAKDLSCQRAPIMSSRLESSIEPFDPSDITLENIEKARQILVNLRIPFELASIILDYAEYWCKQHYERRIALDMAGSHSLKWWASSCLYLQTGSIGYGGVYDDLKSVKPRKVVFSLSSWDGGRARLMKEQENVGTYNGGESLFEVSIFRPDESWTGQREEPESALWRTVPPDLSYQDDKHHATYFLLGGEKGQESIPPWLFRDDSRLVGGFKVIKNKDRNVWFLQRNKWGTVGFSEHIVDWRQTSGIDTEDPNPKTGAGLGDRFVVSLKRGDRIGVWPIVVGPLSFNIVEYVGVDVYYSIY